jgi:Zn-dependent oligopeptidase
MKIIPKTKKDFAWVNFTPSQLEAVAEKHIEKLKKDLLVIKSIPKDKRTFENSILAIEKAGLPEIETNTIALLSYVSPDEKIRKVTAKIILELSKKQLDVMQDKELFRAFNEYKPKNLAEDHLRLYKDLKRSFENMGFHLSAAKEKELVKIKKEIGDIDQQAGLEINNDRRTILCTKAELEGLDEGFITKLPKDKKTGKYIVSTDYPEFKPFAKNAKNNIKRKELIDQDSLRGGKKNLERLAKILILRDQKSKILGYKNHAEYVLEEKIAKNPANVEKFLVSNLSKLKIDYQKLIKKIEKVKGSKLEYFDYEYYFNEFIKNNYSVDESKIKEYFELNNVLSEIFKLFGGLFKVSFVRNTEIKLWHEDVFMFDVMDGNQKVAHLAFDLFPRKGKYGHACHWSMAHGSYNEELKAYDAPMSVIIANYAKAEKNNPSLLTFWDVEAFYHEFGHACHALLTRAKHGSQSGTSVRQDFVETPSQLFEMWLDDNEYLKSISSHYKTDEHLSLDVIEKIQAMRNVQALDQNFRTFVLALFDLKVHLNPKAKILAIRDKILKDYGYFKISKTSLWPASFGHIFGGYDVGYYGYMWALVYSYDVFSRFKKEGIMNKKVGMELRRKILEKGDSEDPIKLMTDFLGRKPNNKAFLEALK